jgi:hypothetical protein
MLSVMSDFWVTDLRVAADLDAGLVHADRGCRRATLGSPA